MTTNRYKILTIIDPNDSTKSDVIIRPEPSIGDYNTEHWMGLTKNAMYDSNRLKLVSEATCDFVTHREGSKIMIDEIKNCELPLNVSIGLVVNNRPGPSNVVLKAHW